METTDQKIERMQQEIDELKAMLSSPTTMPYNLKEIIRNEVIKGEDSTVPRTQTISTPAEGQNLVLPAYPIGILALKWRGKEYMVPHVAKQ